MTNNLDIRFYDTCSLLLAGESLFESNEKFLLSSITIQELKRIKDSVNKDADTKYSARLALKLLDENPDKYEIIWHTDVNRDDFPMHIDDDIRILSDAYVTNNTEYIDRVIFVTNDISLKTIANHYFGDGMIESVVEETDDYKGFKIVQPTEEELEILYSNPDINIFNCVDNEYLVIQDQSQQIKDIRCWDGHKYRYLKNTTLESDWFGKTKAKDIYQQMAIDSLMTNQITMIQGHAGSGKTLLSLAFLMSQLEKGIIDKIIVFCNTVATVNSAKLGYYPGSRDEKLLDSQIGNLLASKLGGREAVEILMKEEKLILLPLSDIRGYDTSNMNAGVYISEAQNLDRTLMKLALQRIGEDCICIIDGDFHQQVDDPHFAGMNNGMRRVSKVFRGQNFYGQIELQNIYRSKISRTAELI